MNLAAHRRAMLTFVLILVPGVARTSTVPPAFIQSWDSIQLPLGLAMGDNDRVFVPNEFGGSSFFRIFNTTGTLLGDVRGASIESYGVALLSDRTVVVSDYYHAMIYRYTQAGALLSSFPTGSYRAVYLTADANDNIYVTDAPGDRVLQFSSDGAMLASWPWPHPTGIVYANGRLYVASLTDGSIAIFDAVGHPVASFPVGSNPEQLATDRDGRIYCAESGDRQLSCFDPDGVLLWTIGPSVPGYEFAPRFISVATRPDGLVLAGDYDHARVLVFQYPTVVPAANSSWGRVKRLFR